MRRSGMRQALSEGSLVPQRWDYSRPLQCCGCGGSCAPDCIPDPSASAAQRPPTPPVYLAMPTAICPAGAACATDGPKSGP
eukprot:scaffold14790_cov138-Isochrysis_galbana.AAC.3